MKKLLFVIAIVLFSLNLFSQGLNFKQKINTTNLMGYWKADKCLNGLFFWKDYKGNLHMAKTISGNVSDLELIKFKINRTNIISETISENNNCKVKSIYKLINNNTIQCITNDGNNDLIIIYTKSKQ
jgi:hypothetical protein